MIDVDEHKIVDEALLSPTLTCRLCLNKHNGPAKNIFQEKVGEGLKGTLAQRLFDLFQIKYEDSAKLPSSVCQQCLYMVDTIYAFHESIKECESRLQELVRKIVLEQNVVKSVDEKRPGLNGHSGTFDPEEDCIISEVDPEQEYESSEDDFSMESDSDSAAQMPLTSLESVFPQQQHNKFQNKVPMHGGVTLNTLEKVSHLDITPADPGNAAYHVTPGTHADCFGLEFTAKNTFLCQYCDMAFTTHMDCVEHEGRHDATTPYICNFCPLRAASRPNLINHIKEVHDAERPYVCTLCNKGFCRRSDLKKHTIVHTGVRPYTCSICTKSFSRNTNLTKHMRIHSSVKPHVCQRCPRSFTTAGELLRHARSHTEVKPFQCKRCSASFARKDKLQLHDQAHYRRDSEFLLNQTKTAASYAAIVNASNSSSGQMENIVVPLNPYGENGSAFSATESVENCYNSILATQLQQRPSSSSRNVSNVKQSHTRIFCCTICTKSFTRERDLQRHQALHLDSLFKCKVCGIGFSRREKLMRHRQEKHGPQYTCDICHISYGKRDALDSHLKMHELQQKSIALNPQAAVISAAITTGAMSSIQKDTKQPQRPSAADLSFYSQMVPTMNLGFYSETRPEDRNDA